MQFVLMGFYSDDQMVPSIHLVEGTKPEHSREHLERCYWDREELFGEDYDFGRIQDFAVKLGYKVTQLPTIGWDCYNGIWTPEESDEHQAQYNSKDEE